MKRLGLAIAAWLLGAAACLAQVPPNAAGTLMVPNGGISSIVAAGTTNVTCTSGTTGVLFQSSGKVACNSAFTFDGSTNIGFGTAGSTNAITLLQTGGTNNAVIQVDGSSLYIQNNAATENMFFDSLGSVIGTFIFRKSGPATVLDYNSTTASTWTFPSAAPVTMASATVKLTGVTTGTNADFLCKAADGTILIQTTACTISSMRFKENILPVDDNEALSIIDRLHPIAFNMKEMERPNADLNFGKRQIGLTAENIAEVDPRMAIYENDGVTPKSYRQESVVAALVGAIRELKSEFEAYRREHP